MFSFILELGLKKKQVFVNFGFAVLEGRARPNFFAVGNVFSADACVGVYGWTA